MKGKEEREKKKEKEEVVDDRPHLMVTDVAMHMDDLDDLRLYYGVNKPENMDWKAKIVYFA